MASNAAGSSSSPQGTTRWDRFLYWAGRFYATSDFDEIERKYKLEIVERIQSAKDALLAANTEWVDKLSHAITAPPNNLTNWRATQPLIAWCRDNPEQATLAFRIIWNDGLPVHQRFNDFATVVATSGQKPPIAETSFMHMAVNPYRFPIFRATPVDRAMDLTGYPLPKDSGIKSGDIGRRYEHFLNFLDAMISRASRNGIHFRDRLDAQSAAWIVTQWYPNEHWSDADKAEFLAYQGEARSRTASWDAPKGA